MVFVNYQTDSDCIHLVSPLCHQRSERMIVFCDLDGPLIDVSQRYYQTYRLAIAQTLSHYQALGMTPMLSPMSHKRFWHMKRERIPDSDIAARTGFVDEQIEFFLGQVKGLVNQALLLQADRLQDWAIAALESLENAGVELALVTLRDHHQAIQVLKRFGIYNYFSQIRGAQDELAAYENYAKYKTEILSNLMETMGLTDRDSMCMIGDTEADILSAKSLGIDAIALSCGMRSAEYLRRLEPDCVLDNLSDATRYVLRDRQVAQ